MLMEHKDSLVKENDPMVERVLNVTNRLLSCNRAHEQFYTKTWTVTVIDSPIENCIVLSVC